MLKSPIKSSIPRRLTKSPLKKPGTFISPGESPKKIHNQQGDDFRWLRIRGFFGFERTTARNPSLWAFSLLKPPMAKSNCLRGLSPSAPASCCAWRCFWPCKVSLMYSKYGWQSSSKLILDTLQQRFLCAHSGTSGCWLVLYLKHPKYKPIGSSKSPRYAAE